MDEKRPKLAAPRGTELRCKGWVQEAALRMLLNNLDPEVVKTQTILSYMVVVVRLLVTGTHSTTS